MIVIFISFLFRKKLQVHFYLRLIKSMLSRWYSTWNRNKDEETVTKNSVRGCPEKKMSSMSMWASLDKGSNCFLMGVRTRISKKTYRHLWFSREGDPNPWTTTDCPMVPLYLHGVFIKAAMVCQKYLNLSVASVIARLHNDKLLMIYKE